MAPPPTTPDTDSNSQNLERIVFSEFFPLVAIGALGIAHKTAQSGSLSGRLTEVDSVVALAALAAAGLYVVLKRKG